MNKNRIFLLNDNIDLASSLTKYGYQIKLLDSNDSKMVRVGILRSDCVINVITNESLSNQSFYDNTKIVKNNLNNKPLINVIVSNSIDE